MDLSIVIVSFNTKDILIECLASVYETAKKIKFEVIVVDNDSKDESARFVKEFVKKNKTSNLILIENKENFGFSKANNIGVEKSNGKFILFLNSDTVVYENTLDGMVEFMEKNQEAGASTCYVVLPNGKMDDAAHRGFPTPWRALTHFSGLEKAFSKSKFFSGYSLFYKSLKNVHEIDSLAGAFMLVRRIAGAEVGWWDEDYFWYGDDLDFCYRLKEHKWKIYFVPEFKILHYKGVSGGLKDISKNITTATDEIRKKAAEARFSAMRIFYDKHYKKKYPLPVTWLVLSGIDLKKLVTKFKRK